MFFVLKAATGQKYRQDLGMVGIRIAKIASEQNRGLVQQ